MKPQPHQHSNARQVNEDVSRKLLVVDDDADIVRSTKLRLKNAGYEVLTANDGESCFNIAQSVHPDAILLDVRMPGEDGLDTLLRLQSQPSTRDIPVVMLSGSVLDEVRSLDLGARFFLKKPCASDRLLSAIEEVI